jgi:hypothetical protein
MAHKQTSARLRFSDDSTRLRRASLVAVLWATAGVFIGSNARAQNPSLIINEPTEWRFKDTLNLGERKSLRISGSATDASGVSSVLVNGQPATLKRDPKNPKFWLFEKTIPSDSVTAEIRITLVPVRGSRLEEAYTADTPLLREQRRNAAAALAKAQTPAAAPAATDSQRMPPPVRGADPWPSFKKRSIGYGAAAGVGTLLAVLSKSDNCNSSSSTLDCANDGGSSGARTFGVGLVAAAVVAFGVDAFLTSRRDNAAKQSVALKSSSSRGFQFAAPAVVDLRTGVGFGVLHLTTR